MPAPMLSCAHAVVYFQRVDSSHVTVRRFALPEPSVSVGAPFARRLAQLQKLPRRDRDALLRTLDAFLAKSSHAA